MFIHCFVYCNKFSQPIHFTQDLLTINIELYKHLLSFTDLLYPCATSTESKHFFIDSTTCCSWSSAHKIAMLKNLIAVLAPLSWRPVYMQLPLMGKVKFSQMDVYEMRAVMLQVDSYPFDVSAAGTSDWELAWLSETCESLLSGWLATGQHAWFTTSNFVKSLNLLTNFSALCVPRNNWQNSFLFHSKFFLLTTPFLPPEKRIC